MVQRAVLNAGELPRAVGAGPLDLAAASARSGWSPRAPRCAVPQTRRRDALRRARAGRLRRRSDRHRDRPGLHGDRRRRKALAQQGGERARGTSEARDHAHAPAPQSRGAGSGCPASSSPSKSSRCPRSHASIVATWISVPSPRKKISSTSVSSSTSRSSTGSEQSHPRSAWGHSPSLQERRTRNTSCACATKLERSSAAAFDLGRGMSDA